VLVGHVVRDDVDDRADADRERFPDQLLGLGEGAERGVDRAVVDDVVAPVRHRRGVPGREPDGVDAEVGEVAQPGADTGEVTDAVAIAVAEAARVDLIDHRIAPPRPHGRLIAHTTSPASPDRVRGTVAPPD
jgi:hypothetical protein